MDLWTIRGESLQPNGPPWEKNIPIEGRIKRSKVRGEMIPLADERTSRLTSICSGQL